MISRPKNTDTMDDVIKMQEEFLKKKDQKEFPAAQVTKLYKGKLFCNSHLFEYFPMKSCF